MDLNRVDCQIDDCGHPLQRQRLLSDNTARGAINFNLMAHARRRHPGYNKNVATEAAAETFFSMSAAAFAVLFIFIFTAWL